MLAIVIAAIFATIQTNGQTTNAPSVNSDKISLVLYGDHFDNKDAYGGGGMLLYNFIGSPTNGFGAAAGIGMDWAGQWYSIAGTLAGHYTVNLSPRNTITFYTFGGTGTSLSGADGDNRDFETIEGSGFHYSHRFTKSMEAGIGSGYVRRQNAGDYSGGAEIITGSITYKSDNILLPIGLLINWLKGSHNTSP